MIASALKRLFSADTSRERAHDAYVQLVAQARRPFFYQEWEVEDSLDGRFDMIVLHVCLAVNRCEAESGDEAKEFVRVLCEIFFADMDRSLREMGSTDTGVGIRVKKMAQAFYGRLKSYNEALDDKALLKEALRRNIYREKPVSDLSLEALADYIMRNRLALSRQPLPQLMQGTLSFTD